MNPLGDQVAPSGNAVKEPSLDGGPPARFTFHKPSDVANPIHEPSGEKKGRRALRAVAISRTEKSSILRI